MLAVIETHPVQYHAPVYQALQSRFGVPVTAIYGSDFSIAGYMDAEFGAKFAWDRDLLQGYDQLFLSRASQGGARNYDEVRAIGLDDALRKIAPKAVLLLGYSSRFDQSAFVQVKKMKYPILFRAETTDHARNRSFFKSTLRDYFLRSRYRNADSLLYIGAHSYQHYQRLKCPVEKLIFSPYCVDASTFSTDEADRSSMRPETRRRLGIDEEQVVILFSGKLSHRKGPDLILQSIKRLPSALRDRICVIFLGSGQMQDQLQQMTLESPQVRALFPGFQNQSQLSPFYHAADFLVLPSRTSETWGLVVNEALHHGLPCVVSEAVGCAPDLIDNKNTGMTFETDSVVSLASALDHVIHNMKHEAARLSCKQKANDYSVEKAAWGIAEAYKKAVAVNPGRRLGNHPNNRSESLQDQV